MNITWYSVSWVLRWLESLPLTSKEDLIAGQQSGHTISTHKGMCVIPRFQCRLQSGSYTKTHVSTLSMPGTMSRRPERSQGRTFGTSESQGTNHPAILSKKKQRSHVREKKIPIWMQLVDKEYGVQSDIDARKPVSILWAAKYGRDETKTNTSPRGVFPGSHHLHHSGTRWKCRGMCSNF